VHRTSPARHCPPSGERATSLLAPLSQPPRSNPLLGRGAGRRVSIIPPSVKDGGWVETGVPSCDEYSLPWPVKQRRGLRRAPLLPNRIAESPPPGHRFCHRGQASNVVVPTRPAARKGSKVGGRFDGEKKDRKRSLTRIFLGPRTEEEGRTGRLSSRSAFQTAYEHNHGRVRPLVDCRRWHR